MGPAVPYIALAFTVGGTVYSVAEQRKAARQQEGAAAEAEKIGRQNAAVIESETRESAKRQKLADDQTSGKARALAAASGVESTGSVGTFLSDLDTAQTESLNWLVKSGENRARIAQLTGEYTAAQGRAGASGTRAGAVSSTISGANSAFNIGDSQNWW